MKKTINSVFLLVVLAFGLLAMLPEAVASNVFVPMEQFDEPLRGSENAPVKIVVFSDFQCPFCARHHNNVVNEIHKEFSLQQVSISYVNFPLSFHLNAFRAAMAGECANLQGKFFEYAQLLFDNQPDLTDKALLNYANLIDLNQEEFIQCFSDPEISQEVQSDFEFGQSLGINGTPTTFINSQKIVGAQDYSTFRTVIMKELGIPEPSTNETKIPNSFLPEPTKGAESAKVKLAVYFGYQDPFSKRFHDETYSRIFEEFSPREVSVTWVNFPFDFHEYSYVAAIAGECANMQGKFFEYTKEAFEFQVSLDEEVLIRLAKRVGLDMKKFDVCFNSTVIEDEVESDIEFAQGLDISATPTIFVNNQKFLGAQPYEAIKEAIEREFRNFEQPIAPMPVVVPLERPPQILPSTIPIEVDPKNTRMEKKTKMRLEQVKEEKNVFEIKPIEIGDALVKVTIRPIEKETLQKNTIVRKEFEATALATEKIISVSVKPTIDSVRTEILTKKGPVIKEISSKLMPVVNFKDVLIKKDFEIKKVVLIENNFVTETIHEIEVSDEIFIKSKNFKQKITVLPREASQIITQKAQFTPQKTTLEIVGEKTFYSANQKKTGKILGFIPVEFEVKVQVDAQTGAVEVIQPFWSFLVTV